VAADPKDIIARLEAMKSRRANWESSWDSVYRHCLPRNEGVASTRADGDRRGVTLVDTTGVNACELLAGALHGMLTNSASKWFDLTADGIGDDVADEEARDWLYLARDEMLDEFAARNLLQALHGAFLDLSSIGTAAMFVGDSGGRPWFSARSIGEIHIDEDRYGRVDTVYRRFERTARQALQQWPEGLPEKVVKDANDPKRCDTRHWFVHAVYPRREREDGRSDGRNKRFASCYVHEDTRRLVDEGGFDEMPYLVPRWAKAAGEVYGRGPGMNALADMKMLQAMQTTHLKAAQKAADPPLMMPDDGFLGPIRTAPGSINYYRAGAMGETDRIEALPTPAKFEVTWGAIEATQEQIRRAFYVDQLQLPPKTPQMTATEVQQRAEDKLRLMGPMVARLQSELLDPLIQRTFAIMLRGGRLPPPPAGIEPGRLKIEYRSTLQRTQQQEEVNALNRLILIAGQIAQFKPDALARIDFEAGLYRAAERLGVHPDVMVSASGAEAAKKAEAAVAAAQAALGAAPGLAKAGLDTAKAQQIQSESMFGAGAFL